MDRKDIKMFLLHCENMYILKMLGADDELIKRLEQRWEDNEEDISIKKTETMCNCSDEKTDIKNAIQTLKIVQNCWADQIPNEGQKISDYDAISQAIECLEEYEPLHH